MAKINKRSDIDKYKYSLYDAGFDSRGTVSIPSGSFAQNAINFGTCMTSFGHANNR